MFTKHKIQSESKRRERSHIRSNPEAHQGLATSAICVHEPLDSKVFWEHEIDAWLLVGSAPAERANDASREGSTVAVCNDLYPSSTSTNSSDRKKLELIKF